MANSADLVITAPDPFGPRLAYLASARMTLGVLIELAVEAKDNLVLAAPYLSEEIFDSGPLAQSIHRALDRGVRVDLASTSDQLPNVPGSLRHRSQDGRLKLYSSNSTTDPKRKLGSHAKFCISDTSAAYLGSANFTTPGLNGHLEVGVLLKDEKANEIAAFWELLKDCGIFKPIE